ncbi:hypothetical protein G9P44_002872 [Scheffersomyces stipitis]|nr:hypothetical protein G9P44_002872 [Scheffersomyces stipitis]
MSQSDGEEIKRLKNLYGLFELRYQHSSLKRVHGDLPASVKENTKDNIEETDKWSQLHTHIDFSNYPSWFKHNTENNAFDDAGVYIGDVSISHKGVRDYESQFSIEHFNEQLKVAREANNFEGMCSIYSSKNEWYSLKAEEWKEYREAASRSDDPHKALLNFHEDRTFDEPSFRNWKERIDHFRSKESDPELVTDLLQEAMADLKFHYYDIDKFIDYTIDYFAMAGATGSEIMNLRLQLLEIPHAGLQDSFSKMSATVSKYSTQYEDDMSVAQKTYSATLKKQKHIEIFELALLREPDNMSLWTEYVKNYAKYMAREDDNALLSIFRRAPKSDESWLPFCLSCIYTVYEQQFRGKVLDDRVLLHITGELTRLFPYHPSAYTEALKLPVDRIKMIITIKNLDLIHKSDYNEWKKVALAILTYLSSGISWNDPEIKKLQEKLDVDLVDKYKDEPKTFQNISFAQKLQNFAIEFAEFAIVENNDIFHSVEKLSITLLERLGDQESVHKLAKQLVERFSDQCEVWLFLINFYISVNENKDFITSLFEKGVSFAKSLDWPERLIEEWIHFETVYGTPISSKKAVLFCNNTLQDLALEIQNESNEEVDDKQAVLSEDEDSEEGDKKRRKLNKNDSSAIVPPRSRENLMVKVENLTSDVTRNDMTRFFSDCGSIRELSIVENSATIEFHEEREVLAAITKDKKKISGKEISVKRIVNCILFVNNYPPSMDQGSIRLMFEQIGKLASIRFPSQRSNHTRRFCYVEYENANSALQAVKIYNGKVLVDNVLHQEFALQVAISDSEAKSDRETKMESQIRVKNIDYMLDIEAIKGMFVECGTVTSVVIPKFQRNNFNQKNNGLAYVTFESNHEAQKAVQMDGKIIGGRPISVALSSRSQKYSQSHKHDNGYSASKYSQFEDVRTVGVTNVDNTLTAEQVKLFFSTNGGVVSKVEIFPEHAVAMVEFEKASDAGNVTMSLRTKQLGNREIVLTSMAEVVSIIKGKKESHQQPVPKMMVPASIRRKRK